MENMSGGLARGAGSFSTDLPDLNMDGDNIDLNQFVAFSIGDQQYCVDIMQVREIRAWDGATALPNSADYIRGVINLRGHIVPVIDLRTRFGQGTTDTTKGAVIVIVMIEEKLHGLLVDAVSDILSVKPDAVADAPSTASDSGLLAGIITHDEQMVAIIELNRLAVE